MEKLDVWIIVGAIVLCLVLLGAVFGAQVVQTGSWGLSFSGAVPQAPESAAALEKLGAYYIGSGEDKVLYLTFDAGYENGCTAQILDVLRKHDAPAVFFLVGNYIEKNPDLVKRMVDEGHTVGNHTLTHPDMSALSGEAFAAELEGLEQLYAQRVGGEPAKLYRPPQGVYSQENLEQAQAMGYRTVFWSLAYADWDNKNQPDPAAAVEKLTGRLHPGAVVLLHSTSHTNAAILDALLTRWEGMGYRFAPITQLWEGRSG